MDETRPPTQAPDPRVGGPLTREAALALLQRGSELLASGDFDAAGEHFARVVGFDDPAITAAALLGLGEVRYRLDDEAAAIATWLALIKLGETPSTYTAWRNLAAARVRAGDLPGAMEAYREADKRAPREDKAEIANRLGWLAKETGDTRSSRRYFAAGRGDSPLLTVTIAVIALTSVVSLTALFATDGQPIFQALWLDKLGVAAGEYWRLWTVTLLHADLLHLFFNMYALFLAGPIVERWYGRIRFLLFYLACAAVASTASFVFGGDAPAVGASGAIFGLFGILLAAGRLHHPVDRQGRALLGQLGVLILINLFFGFASGGTIDNAAHIGGLVSGLWLGALFLPTGVPTLSSLWHRPASTPAAGSVRLPGAGRTGTPGSVALVGLGVVAVVVVAGLFVGTEARRGRVGVTDAGGGRVIQLATVSEWAERSATPR
ncbi:MAG: rhomboid protease GluP [Chloroflexota bacterium]|jgi:membrane associated rhomboid family serine protease|nr:rhomboid protease GluP [Chloroflexota bacterium]